MAHQVCDFVMHLVAKVNIYQLAALGLALTTVIMGMPGGGGSGA
jgi:hypothetical protein